ncbi:MAG TPA: sugar phosphate nucleotidyltransferase [Parvibaculum sp.]|nr:sugar phosphate nucleotidyltransferase [Parvibaculum sp.]
MEIADGHEPSEEPTPPRIRGRSLRTAIVLAGGKGTRLRPFTTTIPKPLVPVGDKPIVELMIERLVRAGFQRVVLAINHMGDLIRAYFGDGSRWNIEISYSLEEEPLGTIGPLRIISDLPENFLVVNADILTDLDFTSLLERHSASDAIFTVAATRREHTVEYGVLSVDEGHLVDFQEKPVVEHVVSMGVYAVSRRVLPHIPETGAFGFDQLMLKLLAAGEKVNIQQHHGFWLDIGRPDDYEIANDLIVRDGDRFL